MSIQDLAKTGKAIVNGALNGPTAEPNRIPGGRASTYAPQEHNNRSAEGADNVITYRSAVGEDVPLTETPFAKAFTVLREFDPMAADHLHARWETQIRLSARTIHQVQTEEMERLAAHNSRAESGNLRIDAEIQRLQADCKKACKPIEALLEAHTKQLDHAHREAAKAAAACGGEYDANAPSETAVLRVAPRDLKSLAASLGLPWVEQDHANKMGQALGHVATIGFGMLFGISLGLVLNFLHTGALLRNPVMFLICVGLGALWASLSRWFLYTTAFQASERFYLGLQRKGWMPFALLTVGLFLITLGLDASVGRAGVVGLAHAKKAGLLSTYRGDNRDSDGVVSIMVALAFSLPYAGYAVWEGFHGGRYHPVMNRLLARQEQELKMSDAHRRSLPEVQAGLHALAIVKDELRQRAELEKRREAIVAPCQQKIADLQGQRAPVLDRPDEAASRRIDQAIHQARGLLADWTQDLDHAIHGCTSFQR
jgi:hypothetical protein